MLKQVKKSILELERQFFEEEASDVENELIGYSMSTEINENAKEHN